VQTIEKMKIFCSKNELLNNKEKNMLKMGLHIDTVIHTQQYTNIVMHEKLKLFYNYLETFNSHHAKHLGRLLKKTKMIVSIISDDMPDDAPASNPDDAPASNPDDAPASNPDDAPASNPDDAPASNPDDAPASNPDDAPDNVESPGDYSENIENDETELDILNRNKLDSSGDVTKFVKSVVAADNISFITKT